MTDKIKVGVIGCGGIANGKHLPSLSQIEEVQLVAFCDVIEERAVKAAKKFGAENAKVFKDYKSLLEEDIDVIHVCTPNESHCEITVASLQSGKHVMCEKPMAKTTEEAKQMIEAQKESGKKLTIGYQNRFRKDSLHAYKLAKDNEFGEIYNAKAHAIRRRAVPTWGVFLDEEAQGGGPLIDIGTHALDLTLWLMDNYEPEFVVGKAYHKLSSTKNAANAWGPWDTDKFTVEDSAFGFVTMKNGATIYLESSWALNSLEVGEAQTTLHGTKAGLSLRDKMIVNGEEHGLLYDKEVQMETGGVDFYDEAGDDEALTEAEYWINCIKNDEEPLVKPEQALIVTQILEAIYESSKQNKPVYIN